MRNKKGQFIKGYVPTQEIIEKMRIAQTGRKHSIETKKKIADSHLGKKRSPFSERWKNKMSIAQKKRFKLMPVSEETKKKLAKNSSKYWLGKIPSVDVRKKISKANKGKKRSKKARINLSNAHKGEKGSNWKGGISSENNIIRAGVEYRLWREAVFARDNWTCQKTGVKGGKIEAHHIQNFSDFPELRFAIDNGITLSKKAHKEFHKKYGKKNNTKGQLEEFLSKIK